MPAEDAWVLEGNRACVADGITRDPVVDTNWGERSMEELLEYYPNPSPASEAAKVTCEKCVSSVNDNPTTCLQSANTAVGNLNRGLECDYLTKDYAGCVAAGAVISQDRLAWASIGDCQVAVFDKEGEKVFVSPNGMAAFEQYIQGREENWRNPKRRVQIRKEFRNNPNQIFEGKRVSYGALTGEITALEFIESGELQLPESARVVLFSDGFAAYLDQPEFLLKLLAGKEEFIAWSNGLAQTDTHKFGRERTLVLLNGVKK